jgi:hypothetical protein
VRYIEDKDTDEMRAANSEEAKKVINDTPRKTGPKGTNHIPPAHVNRNINKKNILKLVQSFNLLNLFTNIMLTISAKKNANRQCKINTFGNSYNFLGINPEFV